MEIDWKNLGFEFMPVKSNIRYHYANGKWGAGKLYNDDSLTLSVASNCLHYGQAAFEGLKAFTCKDGKVRVFRAPANSKRLNSSTGHLLMPAITEEMFLEAVNAVVKDNIDYVPPYGTGGALYIRPVIVGTSPQIGISASEEYEFIVLVVPVGPYYKNGIKPVDAYLVEEFDRAAPAGTGHIKIAGNYAASLSPTKLAKAKGCSVALFLDAATHEHIEEFGTSNFAGITRDGTYVTPLSPSILPSITNMSLIKLAERNGIKVERRPIHKSELAEFVEVGACGTAVVITPIGRIVHQGRDYCYGNEIGPVLKQLYDMMTGIHYGEKPDEFGWMMEVER
ncbi:MAG: branched-chain amino acid aminotransferase [Victivallaceae bacterium]|nr:branched-chain amino acid aminotransferase [Victivallaceae bacterium]